MLVATGTSNMIKVEAVKIAFKHFYRDVRVMNVNTDNLPLQPITLNGTVNGAIKRASTAIQKINDADFGTLSYSEGDIADISITFRFDRAINVF